MNHYGVGNPSQHHSVISKIKKTKLDRYGDENYNNIIQIKKTLFERYGVENPTQHKVFIDKAINTIIEKYGEVWFKHAPRYNVNSILFLDIIGEKLGLHIQHALNGGEKKFVRYWVDGYIEKYNICIEWDEKKHNTTKQKEKDLIKSLFLEDNFKCHIIRINENEFIKNIENGINEIIEKIKNKNEKT